MENKIKRKINTFGRVAKILTMIVIVCLLVAEGFLLAGGVIAAVVPKDSVTVETDSRTEILVDTKFFGVEEEKLYLNVGGGKLYIADFDNDGFAIGNEKNGAQRSVNMQVRQYDMNTALWWIICEAAALAAVIVALYFFRALMKQFMVCDTPFSDSVVKKMRAFAIALIPCMVAYHAASAAKNSVLVNDGSPGLILSVVFVLTIFVLTMIFKYGAELQKEHDDTV